MSYQISGEQINEIIGTYLTTLGPHMIYHQGVMYIKGSDGAWSVYEEPFLDEDTEVTMDIGVLDGRN